MENITGKFDNVFVPVKGLIFFESVKDQKSMYVEAYDTDSNGMLINAHPLSVQESQNLAETLQTSNDLKQDFLTPKGLLPDNILYINAGRNGSAIWYTKAKRVSLFFTNELTISNGEVNVPPLIWKACKDQVSVYATIDNKRPTAQTELYYAPFFNVHKDGRVCMGNVQIDIDPKCCLEEFISQWENYFFNSKFSHLLDNYNPINGNIVQLWQQQVNCNQPFPLDCLKANGKTLKSLIK